MGLRPIVTGGASGIGAATVSRLVDGGYAVAAVDLDAAGLEASSARASAAVDITDAAACTAAIDRLAGELGGLDALVVSHGIAPPGTLEETTLEAFDRVMDVNVRGVVLACRAGIPPLRAAGGGSITVVASQLGLVAVTGYAAYCTSKGAVIQLVRALAIELAPEGIRVNCVCPGPTQTPLVDRFFANADDPDAMRRAFEQTCIHDRLVRADEIADAIAYLASPRAGSTIGAALVVDGGYVIR